MTDYHVFQQDCLEGIRDHVTPGSVDVIVTSPPYNLGKKYGKHDDSQPESIYLDWMGRVADGLHSALSAKGSLFLNLGGKPSDPFWPIRVLERFTPRFTLQNTILWVKSIVIRAADVGSGSSLGKDLAVGHYKPVNSERYLNQTSEYVFHLTKSGDVTLAKLSIGAPYQDKSNVARWGGAKADVRDLGNVWFIPYETVQRARPHPCVFPVKLPKQCITLHGLDRTRLVMDPFVGTGTTGRAAAELGAAFIGFDIDPEYARMARSAVAQGLTARQKTRTTAVLDRFGSSA